MDWDGTTTCSAVVVYFAQNLRMALPAVSATLWFVALTGWDAGCFTSAKNEGSAGRIRRLQIC